MVDDLAAGMPCSKQAQQLDFVFGQYRNIQEILTHSVGQPGGRDPGIEENLAGRRILDRGKRFYASGISDKATACTCLYRVEHDFRGAE